MSTPDPARAAPPDWRLGHGRAIDLRRPAVLAIINLTPDSFYSGSRAGSTAEALARSESAAAEGAAAIDLGAESTRPGAEPVPARDQLARLLPAIEAIRGSAGPAAWLAISIDTTSAEVARAALAAGADAVNDVSAGRDDPGMFDAVAAAGAGLILMHRLTAPRLDRYSDQYDRPPEYADIAAEVAAFLSERSSAAVRAGVAADAIVIDPGLGFGKTVEQNLALIRRTHVLTALGFPVVSGLSRKSFVGRAASPDRQTTPAERLAGSIALTVAHRAAGARLFRVHDVREHVEALRAVDGVA